jgi:hypothetical protein
VTHLWTGGRVPAEYLELILCRDVYHCPPDQLPALSKIMRHLVCMEAEQQVRDAKRG